MTSYALYSLPFAWVGSIAPHFYAISLSSGKDFPQSFENVAPREFNNKVRAGKQTPVRTPLHDGAGREKGRCGDDARRR